jgi:hypothetical protein
MVRNEESEPPNHSSPFRRQKDNIMCKFFSIVTEPENHGGQRFYRDWQYRKEHLDKENDSHSLLCKANGLDEDKCNKYEFNPLSREFVVDQLNSGIDDRVQVADWFNGLDYKTIVEPLIIKPIVHPFKLPKVEQVTDEQIQWLKNWDSVRDSVSASVSASASASVWDSVRDSVSASASASVWDSVRDSVRDSVWDSASASVWDSVRDSVSASVSASVRDSVRYSVWDSVSASVRDSVWDSVSASVWDSVRYSVWDSVWAYTSSFFDITYKYDFSPCVKLWEAGLVPSCDGQTWRLHSGEKAEIVYIWKP